MSDEQKTGPDLPPTVKVDLLETLKGMLSQQGEQIKGFSGRLDQHAEDTKKAFEGIAQTVLDNHNATSRQLTDLDRRVGTMEAWKVLQEGRADANSLRVASLTDELDKERKAREALAEEQASQTVMIKAVYKWTVDMSQKPMVQKIGRALGGLLLLAIAAAAGYLGKGSK